jgi:hypothetical protein
MRVTVSVSNAGRLRSGQENPTPRLASSSPKRRAFDDRGDEAKPCR